MWEPIPDATRPSVKLGIVDGARPTRFSFTFIVDRGDIHFHHGDGIRSRSERLPLSIL